MPDDELCEQCQHLFDPHAVIATTGEPADGGIMLCPEQGCECISTWGVEGGTAKRIPDEQEIAALRRQVQGLS